MGDRDRRTTVKTYVPAYQKQEWQTHADDLDMSLSEFLRTMVQAGRRGFTGTDEESDSNGATPGVDDLETRILGALHEEPQSFDDLLELITDDMKSELEEPLDETLGELQDAGRVRYSGRQGGYVLSES